LNPRNCISEKTISEIPDTKTLISFEEAKAHNKRVLALVREKSCYDNLPEKIANNAKRTSLLAHLSGGSMLRLKVVNSHTLQKNSVIDIGPKGYYNSPRNDGIAFFGCKKKDKDKKAQVNDFSIPVSKTDFLEELRGRQFMIFYDPEVDSYFIRDLGVGFGVFVRIETSTTLKDNQLINIGESYFIVNIDKPVLKQGYSRLRVKVYGGITAGEVLYFSAAEFFNNKITIGRDKTCDVFIDDKLLSKVQASIFYSATAGWVLFDGDIEKQRPSTNGTWLYPNSPIQLQNSQEFKSNSTLLKVKIV